MEDSEPPQRRTSPRKVLQVAESKAKRLERQQSRFRDRGGIFVPTARSGLADILLGRATATPNGKLRARSRSRSPVKRQASVSPSKKTPALSVAGKKGSPKKPSTSRKSTGAAGSRSKKQPSKQKLPESSAEADSVEGPSNQAASKQKKSTKKTAQKTTRAKKPSAKDSRPETTQEDHFTIKPVTQDASTETTVVPPKPAKKSTAKRKEPTPRKAAGTKSTKVKGHTPLDDEPPEPSELGTSRTGSKPRATKSKSGNKTPAQSIKESAPEDSEEVEKPPARSKKRALPVQDGDVEEEPAKSSRTRKKLKTSDESIKPDVTENSPVNAETQTKKITGRTKKVAGAGDKESKATGASRRKRSEVEAADEVVAGDEEDTRTRKRTRTSKNTAASETKKVARKKTTGTDVKHTRVANKQRSRPRKSIMIRIKEPPPPIDDEPDPIDFLC